MDTSLTAQPATFALNLATGVSIDTVARIYSAAHNPNTHTTRLSHLKMLAQYCAKNEWPWREDGVVCFEEGWLVSHITELYVSGSSLATIDGRMDAIHTWSVKLGKPTPVSDFVKKYREGIGNEVAKTNQLSGKRARKEAPAISRDVLNRMVDSCDTATLVGKRDKALLLMGWFGAYRRSELATLSIANVERWDRGAGRFGLLCKVYNTKTNKKDCVEKQIEAQPTEKYCPVVAFNEWISAAGIGDEGAVFRNVDRWGNVGASLSDRSVDKIVRKYAKGYSAHSLRAGYATQSQEDRIPEVYARKQGGWSFTSPIFGRYATRAEVGAVLRVRPV